MWLCNTDKFKVRNGTVWGTFYMDANFYKFYICFFLWYINNIKISIKYKIFFILNRSRMPNFKLLLWKENNQVRIWFCIPPMWKWLIVLFDNCSQLLVQLRFSYLIQNSHMSQIKGFYSSKNAIDAQPNGHWLKSLMLARLVLVSLRFLDTYIIMLYWF